MTTTSGGGVPSPTLAAAGAPLPRYLRCEEAAAILRVAPKTLRNWRDQGRGPRTIRVESRVLWPSADLLAFAEAGDDLHDQPGDLSA